jgi:alpha-L-fucosidase
VILPLLLVTGLACAAAPAPAWEACCWRLADGSGTALADEAGLYPGTLRGAEWAAGLTAGGLSGRALWFHGAGDMVGLGNLSVADRDFTLAAWVCPRRADAGHEREILAKEQCGVGANQFRFYLGPGNRLGFAFCDTAGNGLWPFETEPGRVPGGKWSYVAVTRQGRQLALLVNGQVCQTAETAVAVKHDNALDMRLGARYAPGSDRPYDVFDGLLGECAIWARALSPAELTPPADVLQEAQTVTVTLNRARRPEDLARPTPEQAAWQDYEIGMFIHFAPNTWSDLEGDDLSVPLERVNPTDLDTEQWADVAQAMGARYVVFVAKHVGGFCWWPTETTDYCVRGIPWRNGKGDVLADLAESCRKRGLKLGVYLSPADGKHGVGVGGRAATPEAQQAYEAIYRQQLTELLSRYGEMAEVWFDGSLVFDVADILSRYAPHAMVFQGPSATIRWVGNEEGVAPYPAWNGVRNDDPSRWGTYTAQDGDPDGDRWLPNECDARIRSTWFWNSYGADTLKTVDQLMDMYLASVGRGGVLLLNNTPDPTGRIPEADARRSAELGAEVRRRFGTPLAQTSGTGDIVTLELPAPTMVDHVVTMEDITGGERVREYVLEGLADGEWRELARGTAIGHKKVDRLAPVTVTAVRLRCLESAGEPSIRTLAVYNAQTAPPAQSAEAPAAFTRLGQWTPADVRDGRVALEMDLAGACRDATQYEVVICKTGGAGGVTVENLALLHDGVDASSFVHATTEPATYNVSLTGIGKSMLLRATLSVASDSSGEVLIRPRPLH